MGGAVVEGLGIESAQVQIEQDRVKQKKEWIGGDSFLEWVSLKIPELFRWQES